MKKLIILVIALLALTSVQAQAAPAIKDIEAAFKSGQQALNDKRFNDAIKDFTVAAEGLVALKEVDKARLVYGNVAIINMQQKQWQQAIDVYNKAWALSGKISPDFALKASQNIIACADELNLPRVKITTTERLLASNPKIKPEELANYLAILGDNYRKIELYSLACQNYEKALAQKNLNQEQRLPMLVALGLAQGNLGRYPKAIANLQSALQLAHELELKTQIVEAGSNLGIIYWEMGQYGKAFTLLKQAIVDAQKFQLRRNEGVDWNNMGLVNKAAGRLADANENFQKSYNIALEVKDRKSEAIALSNMALIASLNASYSAAREKYNQSIAIYKEVGFQEGEASSLLGLARIDVKEKNYPAALEKLNNVVTIYEKLQNTTFLASAYDELGKLYQQMSNPQRRTRDLVFDDTEAVNLTLSPNQALAKSREYFYKSLSLARSVGAQGVVWEALHGLAYADYRDGKLEEAEKLYSEAIDVLLSMRGAMENPDLLQAFLYDKDQLFSEAISVCAELYDKNKDQNLLNKQLRYDEIYRNEIMRTNMRMASLSYSDPEKQSLYNDIMRLSSSQQKMENNLANARNAVERADDKNGDQVKAELLISTKEAEALQKEFQAKLNLWKSKYPQDAVLFDSMVQVDTKQLQGMLNDKQALVQYLPLDDALIIIAITKEKIELMKVDVGYKELATLIRDELLGNNIEIFGRGTNDEAGYYKAALDVLHKLYNHLYAPVASALQSKSHIYFLTSKYLSYVPFAALVSDKSNEKAPRFLIHEKTISLTRLSFIKQVANSGSKALTLNIISVGDPIHNILQTGMGKLDGAKAEATSAITNTKEIQPNASSALLVGAEATKSAWYKAVQSHAYGIMYFATHAVPYAEMEFTVSNLRQKIPAMKPEAMAKATAFVNFYDKEFQNASHLNGFLYMSYPDDNEDGMLSLKDLLALPDSVFAKAYLAVLSACNTGVSYSPKIFKSASGQRLEDKLDAEAAQQVAESGWTPGVDQVCLVDTFMRRNFKNVFGTLWFADDVATAFIMQKFMSNLNKMPPAEALRAAQLAYLENPPERPPNNSTNFPIHPFFWAAGNMFGQ